MTTPFHLAIPVHHIPTARDFYGKVLGCKEGRAAYNWIDFDFFGHQLVVHLDPKMKPNAKKDRKSPVDALNVPIPHFGAVLPWDQWEALAERIREAGVTFVVEPGIRFEGKVGEQGTMFFYDPSGNALEFKSFKNMDNLFAK